MTRQARPELPEAQHSRLLERTTTFHNGRGPKLHEITSRGNVVTITAPDLFDDRVDMYLDDMDESLTFDPSIRKWEHEDQESGIRLTVELDPRLAD
jgi:hypothetical protein